jgi:hypothetical protein
MTACAEPAKKRRLAATRIAKHPIDEGKGFFMVRFALVFSVTSKKGSRPWNLKKWQLRDHAPPLCGWEEKFTEIRLHLITAGQVSRG